jgi:ABC-type uncharacterized transport system auxiliary subunit
MTRRAAVALAGLVLATLTGCGDGSPAAKTIDPSRVEKAIEVSVAEQSHRLSIVVCPTGIKREQGKTFVCIATLGNGQKYPFNVTQKDDRANVSYEQAAGGGSRGNASGG